MTKKQRKEFVRALIDRQKKYVVWEKADTDSINALTGWNHRFYRWIDNPRFPMDPRCIAASDDGNIWDVHSWNKAIDGYSTRNNLHEAMRDAIRDDMREHMRASVRACSQCQATDNLAVDHKEPPFITIATEYAKENAYVEQSLINESTGAGWKMQPHAAAHWRAYHAQYASYQILCRSCNSRKGARV